jgi:hypothetical protein
MMTSSPICIDADLAAGRDAARQLLITTYRDALGHHGTGPATA